MIRNFVFSTGFSQTFPFTAQKGNAWVCLVPWETSSTQSNPNQSHPGCHLEAERAASGRLGKASCAAGSWLRDGLEGGGNVSSDSGEDKGRKKHTHWTLPMCARNSAHMLSLTHPEASTRWLLWSSCYRYSAPHPSETGSSPAPEAASFPVGAAKAFFNIKLQVPTPTHHTPNYLQLLFLECWVPAGCEDNQGEASLKERDFAWSLCTNFLIRLWRRQKENTVP